MAEAIAPLEFTGSDRATVGKLALLMKGVAAVLLLLAVVNVVGGILTLVGGFPLGLLAVVEGALTPILREDRRLYLFADVRYTVDTHLRRHPSWQCVSEPDGFLPNSIQPGNCCWLWSWSFVFSSANPTAVTQKANH